MKKQLILSLSFLLVLSKAAGAAETIYYWSNQAGLKKVDNCQLTTMKNHRFAFSKAQEFKNSEGKPIVPIIDGSLIKKVDQAKGANNFFEVVGVNYGSLASGQTGFADRLERGYLDEKTLDSIEGRTIFFKEATQQIKAGTYLKVHGDKEYLRLSCPGLDSSREYLVFHAYSANMDKATALIGVYWDETGLFKNIRVMTNAAAEKEVSAIVEEKNIVLDQIKSVSGKSVAITTTPVIPLEKDVQTLPPPVEKKPDDVKVMGLNQVVCSAGTANVRNENLSKVTFVAKKGEKVKVFQGWGENKKDAKIDGKNYTFIRVEFPDREPEDQKIGFLVESLVVAESSCPFTPITEADFVVTDTSITGLEDPACCLFPTLRKVTDPFTTGMRQFAYARDGGARYHAANDLYRFNREPIVAVAPGVVLRATTEFYEGTFVTEVLHPGGFIVRYGELTGKTVSGVTRGKQVKMGQTLGYISQIGSLNPMLHFELYSGVKGKNVESDSGKLSQLWGNKSYIDKTLDGKKFSRRSDLLKPTPYLLKWENEKFKK